MSRPNHTSVKLYADELDMIMATLEHPIVIDALDTSESAKHDRLLNRLYRASERL